MNLQNPKFVLIAIAVLFLTPLLLALFMQSNWWNFQPSAFANRGILVEPPILFPFDMLQRQSFDPALTQSDRKKWTLLFPFGDECNRPCLEAAASLRQIHLATGKDQNKVGIALLTRQQPAAELIQQLNVIYPLFEIFIDESNRAVQLLGHLNTGQKTDFAQLADGQAFLLDPDNNIILRYTSGFDPNDIARDLDRLLTWSGID
jgi:hypothetical protein